MCREARRYMHVLTLPEVMRFATAAYGEPGAHAVRLWDVFNRVFFAGVLRPIPIVFTATTPHGGRLASCCARRIELARPRAGKALVADAGVLLHEMMHQALHQRGEDPTHAGAPWRRELMRLHLELTGDQVWAGRSQTMRRPVSQGGGVYRGNARSRFGARSMPQADIAAWPHSRPEAMAALVRRVPDAARGF